MHLPDFFRIFATIDNHREAKKKKYMNRTQKYLFFLRKLNPRGTTKIIVDCTGMKVLRIRAIQTKIDNRIGVNQTRTPILLCLIFIWSDLILQHFHCFYTLSLLSESLELGGEQTFLFKSPWFTAHPHPPPDFQAFLRLCKRSIQPGCLLWVTKGGVLLLSKVNTVGSFNKYSGFILEMFSNKLTSAVVWFASFSDYWLPIGFWNL